MNTLAAQEITLKLRHQVHDLWDAGIGDNHRPVPIHLVEYLRKYAAQKEYTSLHGVEGLSEALSTYLAPWSTFVFGNGLKELLFVSQLAFKGTVIHITPSCNYEQLQLMGKKPVELRTSLLSNWKVHPEQLEECFRQIDGPKMLLFNNPNNPTGVCYTPHEVAILGRICHQHDVIVLADETYSNIVFDDTFVSIGVHTMTIRASSLAKDLGCGGYKLGWLAFPKELEELMSDIKQVATTIYSAAAAPIQYAFRDYLNAQHYGPQCKDTREFYSAVCERVCTELRASTQLRFVTTQAAWYVFVSFEEYTLELASHKIQNDVQLAVVLLNEVGIVTVPGITFRCFDLYCLRFSLVDMIHMDAGVQRFIHWLSDLKCTYNNNRTKKKE